MRMRSAATDCRSATGVTCSRKTGPGSAVISEALTPVAVFVVALLALGLGLSHHHAAGVPQPVAQAQPIDRRRGEREQVGFVGGVDEQRAAAARGVRALYATPPGAIRVAAKG